MSRTITVPTDVFPTIWAKRLDGEESEGAILRRLLGCKPADTDQDAPATTVNGACIDIRNNVHFRRGFVIFRTYKRCEYEAVVQDGAWLRKDNGRVYPTLNQLNSSIVAGAENIWNGNWKFRTEDGYIRSIDEFRQQGR